MKNTKIISLDEYRLSKANNAPLDFGLDYKMDDQLISIHLTDHESTAVQNYLRIQMEHIKTNIYFSNDIRAIEKYKYELEVIFQIDEYLEFEKNEDSHIKLSLAYNKFLILFNSVQSQIAMYMDLSTGELFTNCKGDSEFVSNIKILKVIYDRLKVHLEDIEM